ncbi:MAG: hypothetical protein QM765_38815 [Myxococcales bacterium]
MIPCPVIWKRDESHPSGGWEFVLDVQEQATHLIVPGSPPLVGVRCWSLTASNWRTQWHWLLVAAGEQTLVVADSCDDDTQGGWSRTVRVWPVPKDLRVPPVHLRDADVADVSALMLDGLVEARMFFSETIAPDAPKTLFEQVSLGADLPPSMMQRFADARCRIHARARLPAPDAEAPPVCLAHACVEGRDSWGEVVVEFHHWRAAWPLKLPSRDGFLVLEWVDDESPTFSPNVRVWFAQGSPEAALRAPSPGLPLGFVSDPVRSEALPPGADLPL